MVFFGIAGPTPSCSIAMTTIGKVVASLNSTSIYRIASENDGVRSVRNFCIRSSGTTITPTSISACCRLFRRWTTSRINKSLRAETCISTPRRARNVWLNRTRFIQSIPPAFIPTQSCPLPKELSRASRIPPAPFACTLSSSRIGVRRISSWSSRNRSASPSRQIFCLAPP